MGSRSCGPIRRWFFLGEGLAFALVGPRPVSGPAAAADQLRATEFARVSRSAIVRIDRIRVLKRRSHGEYMIVLRHGTRVKSSRGCHRLEELLES